MKEITLPINETKGSDLRTMPIDVTDDNGNHIGSIFLGIGSANIFIQNNKLNKTYIIKPWDIWSAVFPDSKEDDES